MSPRPMKRQINPDKLYSAFIEGGLGTDEDYPVWTPLWALRAKIWQQKKLKKDARKMLGKLALGAIEGADAPLLRRLADSLERMLQFERSPERRGDRSHRPIQHSRHGPRQLVAQFPGELNRPARNRTLVAAATLHKHRRRSGMPGFQCPLGDAGVIGRPAIVLG